MFGNACQQISFLGMSHVVCNIIWYQVCNSRPCCSPGWWGIELKILLNYWSWEYKYLFMIFETPGVFVVGCYLLWNDILFKRNVVEYSRCKWEIGVLQRNHLWLYFDLGPKGVFINSVRDTMMCTKVSNLQHEGWHVSASLDFSYFHLN